MTPKFARAVDPVFTYMLDLLERIDNTQELDPPKEKSRLMERIDTAGSVLGHAEEWTELARYAIVAWIDSELTDDSLVGGTRVVAAPFAGARVLAAGPG